MLSAFVDFFHSDIKSLININNNTVKALERLQIIKVRDLLFYRPNSYQIKILSPNLSKLQDGQLILTEVEIKEISLPAKRHQPLKILASNDTGSILLIFFNKLPSFIFNKLKIGSKHIISGKVQVFDFYFQISHPEFCQNRKFLHTIEPVYSLTYGVISRQIHSYILNIIKIFEIKCRKIEFKNNKEKQYIDSLLADLKIIHACAEDIKQNQFALLQQKSIRDMSKKELIANQISLHNIRKEIQQRYGNCSSKAIDLQELILNKLGFELTSDQQKVIEEIEADQKSPSEMMRLLQGDVGSGKTLVALLTMANAVNSGFQVALMAPTDLLANQHYQFFVKALNESNIRVELLTGKILGKARSNIISDLENGKIEILIGTHALFQEKVSFKKLGFIVIDEQHKFGVQQRLNLINKAANPDVLVMTATPIPRSLTLTMFGDMSVSKLMNKPKNRLPIYTTTVSYDKVNKVIESLNKKLLLGEKIYWICPLIDQNDLEDSTPYLMDVTSRFNRIDQVYPGVTGILHGKMKNDEKETIMNQFKSGEIKILVATTIVEVGIDVPEATLIVIENAEQFGLAQLHQIRGRVGRGCLLSHCILLYNPKRLSSVARKRFEVMKSGNDGFYIAEQDLLLRGGGEILGTKQSGEGRFFFADLTRDTDLLTTANKEAESNSLNDIEYINFQIRLFAKTELNELN